MEKETPKPKLVTLRSVGNWIFDHPSGSVTVWPQPGKTLDIATANFLLDMAKKSLLE